ncbi:MAG TPA: hypothetical protein VLD38_07310 [Nitrosopumilaceae archaeon]|nr:hypothetical protein [Nitrosopumilaceae archaeon]
MDLRAISGISIVILLLGITSSSSHVALALGTDDPLILKKDLKLIMKEYKAAVTKAKAELISSIKKANADAKLAVQKGIPMDEINAATKATIAKARAELKLDIQKAKIEAKAALLELKAAVDRNNLIN